MSEILKDFLLVWDKSMPKMHLEKCGIAYSAYGPFIENKGRIKRLKKQKIQIHIYQN